MTALTGMQLALLEQNPSAGTATLQRTVAQPNLSTKYRASNGNSSTGVRRAWRARLASRGLNMTTGLSSAAASSRNTSDQPCMHTPRCNSVADEAGMHSCATMHVCKRFSACAMRRDVPWGSGAARTKRASSGATIARSPRLPIRNGTSCHWLRSIAATPMSGYSCETP